MPESSRRSRKKAPAEAGAGLHPAPLPPLPPVEENAPDVVRIAAEILSQQQAGDAAPERSAEAKASVARLMEINRRNLDAIVAAQASLAKGYFALAQRHAALMRDAVEKTRLIMTEGLARDGAAPRDIAQSAIAGALAGMRDIAELAARSNAEAAAIINRRVLEGLGDIAPAKS